MCSQQWNPDLRSSVRKVKFKKDWGPCDMKKAEYGEYVQKTMFITVSNLWPKTKRRFVNRLDSYRSLKCDKIM